MAQIHRALIWWENGGGGDPSLSFSIAHSLQQQKSSFSRPSLLLDNSVVFPCTKELERGVDVLKTGLYAFFLSTSIYKPSSSLSDDPPQPPPAAGVDVRMELQSIPFRPLFYDLCVPASPRGLLKNLELVSKGQTRVSRVNQVDEDDDDEGLQDGGGGDIVEDKKSGSGVLGWFGL